MTHLLLSLATAGTLLLWFDRTQDQKDPVPQEVQMRSLLITDEQGVPCIRLSGSNGSGVIEFLQVSGRGPRILLGHDLYHRVVESDEDQQDPQPIDGLLLLPAEQGCGFSILSDRVGNSELAFRRVGESEAKACSIAVTSETARLTLNNSSEKRASLELGAEVTAGILNLFYDDYGIRFRIDADGSFLHANYSGENSEYSEASISCAPDGSNVLLVQENQDTTRKIGVSTKEAPLTPR